MGVLTIVPDLTVVPNKILTIYRPIFDSHIARSILSLVKIGSLCTFMYIDSTFDDMYTYIQKYTLMKKDYAKAKKKRERKRSWKDDTRRKTKREEKEEKNGGK